MQTRDAPPEHTSLTQDEPLNTDTLVSPEGDTDASIEQPSNNAEQEAAPAITPIPRGQMLALCIVFFCEAYNFTFIFSFLGFMIVDFGLVNDEREAGYYAGIVAATFATCQFFSGFVYGYLSDRYSKKRVIMFGNIGTALSVACFGFSVNFPMAVCFRGINGALNANIATAKAYLSEMTDSTNQSKGFSLQGLSWNVGAIAGPAIGGLLSRPTQKYPNVFDNAALKGLGSFLTMFPYLLPAMLSSVLMFVGFFVGWKYLVDKPSPIPAGIDRSDDTALLKDITEIELETVDEKSVIETPEPPKPVNPFRRLVDSFRIVFNRDFCLTVAVYVIIVAVAVSTDEIWPLWSMLPTPEGGLGFETTDIGLVQALCGFCAVLIQLLLFQFIVKKIGKLGALRLGLLSQSLMVATPQIALLIPLGKVPLWAMLVGFAIVRAFWSSLAFTSMFILISNSAPPGRSGMANGLSHSITNVSRIITPVIAGPLFAWTARNGLPFPLDMNLPFIIMTLLMIIGAAITLFLPKTINEPKSENNRVSPTTIISVPEEIASAVE
jgi:MFS family permease